MYNACLSKWDLLVEHWDLFEQKGLNAKIIEENITLLEPPIANIGCGRGSLVKKMNDFFSTDQVTGFDSSENMITICKQQSINNVILVNNQKPINNKKLYKTILVSTGVIDPLEPEELKLLLLDLKQKLLPDGNIILAYFSISDEIRQIAEDMGALTDLGCNTSYLFDLCKDYHKKGCWEKVLKSRMKNIDLMPYAIEIMQQYNYDINQLANKKRWDYLYTVEWMQDVFPAIERLIKAEELKEYLNRANLKIKKNILLPDNNICLTIAG